MKTNTGNSVLDSDALVALVGHPHKDEILSILGEDPEADPCRREGWVVNMEIPWEYTMGNPHESTHKLAHWRKQRPLDAHGEPVGSRFDPEAYRLYQENQKALRSTHGLGFIQRPDYKGVFSLRPSSRAKMLQQYKEQVREEGGEL